MAAITGNWTVPTPRPSKIWVELWGAGAGGSKASPGHNADGGGGGAYARVLLDLVALGWTAGQNKPYAVSYGGRDVPSVRTPEDTTFDTAPIKCLAKGGFNNLGGLAASCTGDVKRDGGDGQDVTPAGGASGGGGGAGATRAAAGTDTAARAGAVNSNPLCGVGGTGGLTLEVGGDATIGPGNGAGGCGEATGIGGQPSGTACDGALAIWDASSITDFDTLFASGAQPIFTVGTIEPVPVTATRDQGFIM